MYSIWTANKYLVGSTSKTIPYELVYALTTALEDWSSGNNLVTTALTDDFNFYFQGIDPDFNKLVESYLGIELNYDLIQIALPKLYIHKPLYSIPLYHELGHFIDNKKRITKASLLLHPPSVRTDIYQQNAHRSEYFADLFSVSYTGESTIIFLNEFASDAPDSYSHPATNKRIKIMTAFLEGISNDIIDIFTDTLNHLKLPSLRKRFITPNLDDCYNNIRPYPINDKKELHGILTGGWNHLISISENNESCLKDISNEFEPARIINDITEKSIRNMILKSKWQNGTAQQRKNY